MCRNHSAADGSDKEDPAFTVKTAVVATSYPGASPEQVELEVTERIELVIQEMAQIDYLESWSRAGMSQIKVNIRSEYWSDLRYCRSQF